MKLTPILLSTVATAWNDWQLPSEWAFCPAATVMPGSGRLSQGCAVIVFILSRTYITKLDSIGQTTYYVSLVPVTASSFLTKINAHPWQLSGPGGTGSDRVVGGGPAEQARAGVHFDIMNKHCNRQHHNARKQTHHKDTPIFNLIELLSAKHFFTVFIYQPLKKGHVAFHRAAQVWPQFSVWRLPDRWRDGGDGGALLLWTGGIGF